MSWNRSGTGPGPAAAREGRWRNARRPFLFWGEAPDSDLRNRNRDGHSRALRAKVMLISERVLLMLERTSNTRITSHMKVPPDRPQSRPAAPGLTVTAITFRGVSLARQASLVILFPAFPRFRYHRPHE